VGVKPCDPAFKAEFYKQYAKRVGAAALAAEPKIKDIVAALVAYLRKRTAANRTKLAKLHEARTVWYGDEVTLKSDIEKELA
jgi:hypothetical protein